MTRISVKDLSVCLSIVCLKILINLAVLHVPLHTLSLSLSHRPDLTELLKRKGRKVICHSSTYCKILIFGGYLFLVILVDKAKIAKI